MEENIIQFLINQQGFKLEKGIDNLGFSYSMETKSVLVKGDIKIVIGLFGKLHIEMMINKGSELAYYQNAFSVTKEKIVEIIDTISKPDYSYLRKNVCRITIGNPPSNIILRGQVEYEYDFFMIDGQKK